jgi:hypothetical protein
MMRCGLIDERRTSVVPRWLAFPFSRSRNEVILAEYVIREHHRGRALHEILEDAYVTNRCSREQIERLFDQPELVHAIGADIIAAHRSRT